MIKILNIVGARPQIIKSAAISREIRNSFSNSIEDIIVHTGQHYDENMSEIFFTEMGIPQTKYNLNVGSGSHGTQTSKTITGIEKLILREKPHCVVVYGDTNSTLATAVAASKIHYPVVHIEAGLRSFNKNMPEEINRIVCDNVSTLLFSPTKTGIQNLVHEGFNPHSQPPYTINNPGIFHCGDVMLDNALFFAEKAVQQSKIIQKYSLVPDKFILVTIHRDFNTENTERLSAIFKAILEIAADNQVSFLLPLHPRTRQVLEDCPNAVFKDIKTHKNIVITDAVSFFDILILEKNAEMIFTDSGGVQKEAFFYHKPCLILRPQTEWTELVECGAARLCDADKKKISDNYYYYRNNSDKLLFPSIFGDGKASHFICSKIVENFRKN